VLGLPTGLALAFTAGLGALGIWIGLATGLFLVAILMLPALDPHVRDRRVDAEAHAGVMSPRNGRTEMSLWKRAATPEAINARWATPGPGLLGIRITELAADALHAEMPVDHRHAQPMACCMAA
jgi:hypothetical protein